MGCFIPNKKRTAKIAQSTAVPSMTQIGSKTLPALIPKNVFFIIVRLSVSGKTLTIFCIALGMTSIGSVVPAAPKVCSGNASAKTAQQLK